MAQYNDDYNGFPHVIYLIGHVVDYELQSIILKLYRLLNQNNTKTHYIYFSCSKKAVDAGIALIGNGLDLIGEAEYNVQEEQFKDAIKAKDDNCIVNIFGHGNKLTSNVEINHSDGTGYVINTLFLNNVGTQNSEKKLLFIFCSCYTSNIFNAVEHTNLFAILPNQCDKTNPEACMSLGDIVTINKHEFDIEGFKFISKTHDSLHVDYDFTDKMITIGETEEEYDYGDEVGGTKRKTKQRKRKTKQRKRKTKQRKTRRRKL